MPGPGDEENPYAAPKVPLNGSPFVPPGRPETKPLSTRTAAGGCYLQVVGAGVLLADLHPAAGPVTMGAAALIGGVLILAPALDFASLRARG